MARNVLFTLWNLKCKRSNCVHIRKRFARNTVHTICTTAMVQFVPVSCYSKGLLPSILDHFSKALKPANRLTNSLRSRQPLGRDSIKKSAGIFNFLLLILRKSYDIKVDMQSSFVAPIRDNIVVRQLNRESCGKMRFRVQNQS